MLGSNSPRLCMINPLNGMLVTRPDWPDRRDSRGRDTTGTQHMTQLPATPVDRHPRPYRLRAGKRRSSKCADTAEWQVPRDLPDQREWVEPNPLVSLHNGWLKSKITWKITCSSKSMAIECYWRKISGSCAPQAR